MRTKTFVGWMIILVISFLPVFLWFSFGAGAEDFTNYSNITHSLGELFGLVGMTMFALTFVLSTRIKFIEDIFGGLDKVYITHGILGGSALIMILSHPIFLVLKFIPKQISLAATYLLPSVYWSTNFGIIALTGMMLLVFITLFSKMKYHKWKFTHEFLGAMFILAVLHIFLVRIMGITNDKVFSGYFVYAGIVSSIGVLSFCYSLFIKNRLMRNAVYKIKSTRQYKDIFEITISPEHKPISYKAGQFIFLRFYNEKIRKEAHPFSIASKSNGTDIVIVVKKLGDYTSELHHLKVGDKVSVEGPYGRFNYKKHSDTDSIWIAGGIGITPFLGMAQDLFDKNQVKNKITLFYSVKSKGDLLGDALFKNIVNNNPNFSYVPWISDERDRLDIQTIYNLTGKSFSNKDFFLCGPTKFKESIIKSLINNKVPENNIHEEAFDFR